MARDAGCVVTIGGLVEGEAHEAFEWHRSGGADAVPEFLAERSERADLLLRGLARHQELRTPASGHTDPRSVARACRRLASSTMPERSMPMPNIHTTQVSGSIHRAASGACRSLPPGETSKSMSGSGCWASHWSRASSKSGAPYRKPGSRNTE